MKRVSSPLLHFVSRLTPCPSEQRKMLHTFSLQMTRKLNSGSLTTFLLINLNSDTPILLVVNVLTLSHSPGPRMVAQTPSLVVTLLSVPVLPATTLSLLPLTTNPIAKVLSLLSKNLNSATSQNVKVPCHRSQNLTSVSSTSRNLVHLPPFFRKMNRSTNLSTLRTLPILLPLHFAKSTKEKVELPKLPTLPLLLELTFESITSQFVTLIKISATSSPI